MIQILIEAGILIALLNLIGGDEVGMLPAVIIAICTLVGLSIINAVLVGFLPVIAALVVSIVIATIGLGAALSLFLGTPLKSSCIVALAFLGCHVVITICMALLFQAISPAAAWEICNDVMPIA